MKYAFTIITSGLIMISACGTTVSSSSEQAPAVNTEPVHAALPLETESSPSLFTPSQAAFPGEVTESSGTGEIDWSGNSVRATGTGVVDTGNPNRAQAVLMAERAAVVVAQRNLLETVQGVRVDSETRVENFMTDYDVIYTRVDGIVKNARQLGPAVYDSVAGVVEVELEMEIHAQQGLSGAISAALGSQELGRISMSDQTMDFLQQYSALVFDGTEAGLQPSMYPKIYDSSGNLLIDTSRYASYIGAEGQTAIQFISDLDRVLSQSAFSGSPLVVNVRQITGQLGTDIVLGQEESDALGWLRTGLPFLMSAGRFLLGVL